MEFRYLTIIILTFFSISLNAKPIPDKRKINMVFIGNSITEASYLKYPPPAMAVEYLRNKGCEVRYSNCGVSGTTTVDFLPASKGVFKKVIKEADKLYEKDALFVFSFSIGTNDSAIKGPTGAPVSADSYQKNLQIISDTLLKRYPGCKIVLNRPIWYSENTYNSAMYLKEGLDRLQSYFAKIQTLAVKNPTAIFVGDTSAYSVFEKYHLTYHSPQKGKAGTFYLHPNQDGATVLGEFWAKRIYSLFISHLTPKFKVACIGNSITNSALLDYKDKYPVMLQRFLGDKYEVRNYGIGMRTMLKKGDFPYWKEEKYAEVLEWKLDIVIIKLGTNDSKNNNWVYKNEFEGNYIEFINSFKTSAKKIRIYVCFPLPLFSNNIIGISDSRIKDEIIPLINSAALKTGSKSIDLHTPMLDKASYTYDNLHPNAEGTNIIARLIYNSIR